MADPQIKGLPPGATVEPIRGLPAGATAEPIAGDTLGEYSGELDKRGANAGDRFVAPPPVGSMPWMKQKLYQGADKVTNALPAIAGAGGGLLGLAGGPLGAIAGATIGGSGGESARQLIRRVRGLDVPKTSSDAAERIGGEGLRQGAYEASGQGLRLGAKALAPKVAEAALGIPQRVKKFGAEPGKALLNDTTGLRPSKIAASAQSKIDELDESANAIASQSPKPASLTDARSLIDKEIATAQKQQSPSLIKSLSRIKDQLTYEYGPNGEPIKVPSMVSVDKPNGLLDEFGRPIQSKVNIAGPSTPKELPGVVPADKMRHMRRGIDEEVKSWTPPGMKPNSTIEGVRHQMYGVLSKGSQEAAPGTAALDKNMSSLIPVHDYAENKALAEGIVPQALKRLQTPTGALIGAGIGLGAGYQHGGVPGAMAGAAAGLVAPSIASDPGLWIGGARALNSPITGNLIRGARYIAPLAESQRKRPEEENQIALP